MTIDEGGDEAKADVGNNTIRASTTQKMGNRNFFNPISFGMKLKNVISYH